MQDTEAKIAVAARAAGYRSARRYKARARAVFGGVPLAQRRVLDVGCGSGAFALWAGIHGAAKVLGIEPETAGSTKGTLERFRWTIQELQLERTVFAKEASLEDLSPDAGPFDVAILYNVINHLDEEATTRLHRDTDAVARFVAILTRLRELLAPDGIVLVVDMARFNLWNMVGLKSPFAPTIEWHKHQQPEVWIRTFEQAGYRLRDLDWNPLYPLGRLSQNRAMQYLTGSSFILRMRVANKADYGGPARSRAATGSHPSCVAL
ncbi:MAG: class I SAM-dependent methyltransferase [Verrucomicrobiota bacterium]